MLSLGFAAGAAVPVATAVNAIGNAMAHPSIEVSYVGPALGTASAPGWCGVLQCYTPQEVQEGYGYTSAYARVGGYAKAGAGQTIVIFDAFGDPAAAENLAVFDATFGLPPAHLNIICPQGCPTLNYTGPNGGDEMSWAQEITLDTQYSHAMAPAAKIDLVVAYNDSFQALFFAEEYAFAHHLGNIWSQSWGAPECSFVPGPPSAFQAENALYREAAAQGITIFASSGDSWSQEGCPYPSALYPSSDPFNIAVTGTYLDLSFAPGASVSSPLVTAPARYGHETTWNDFENATLVADGLVFGGTGGAPSVYFPAPSYQLVRTVTPYTCAGSTPSTCFAGVPYHSLGRVSSDVAYDAGVDGGVLAYMNFTTLIPAGWYIFGGTSAGPPQWSAITAIADQLYHTALGDYAPALYALVGTPAFHDITVGSNTAEPGYGFLSTPGWDAASGVGSPNVGVLIQALA